MSDNNPQQGQGVNPAWNEFLEAIPEDYRDEVQPLVTPVLQKWDQGVQQRFEEYKPYEKYAKEKIDPQVMDYALGLLNTLNDNDGALQVFNQLGSYLEEQGLLDQEEDPKDKGEEELDLSTIPPALKHELEKLQQGFTTLAQYNLAQKEAEQQAKEDADLERELKSLADKYGEYDENWVLAQMMNGMDAEDAVKGYHEWLDTQLKERNRPKSFKALGSGGDFPSGSPQFDPKKASDQEVKNHTAELLMELFRNK